MDISVLLIIPLAFVSQFVSSALGLGYGISLVPILLLMGYEPLEIVPAVLFSEFLANVTAAFFHHKLKNVNFNQGSKDVKVVILLSLFSILGVILSVFVAVKLPTNILKIWIGVIVIAMGINPTK